MKNFLHHTKETICPGCEDRLKEGHPYMVVWFHDMKENYPNMHCSWVYRDRRSQEEAFNRKASRLHWPFSAHNKTDEKENPRAEAIDIFQIIDTKAVFDELFCKEVWLQTKDHYDIKWGGMFTKLGDFGHFEMDPHPKLPED